MCGIIDFEKKDTDFTVLREMGRAMVLRGQDQSGAYINGGIGMFHNRRIIGEPEHAREPYTVSRNSKNYTVCFDGTLKNTESRGTDFEFLDFESAAETVLECYLSFGTDLFSYLQGDYAFVICDEYRGEILMAKSPGGKKPLFYTVDQGKLIFASEVKGMLRAVREVPTVNTQLLSEHLKAPMGEFSAGNFYTVFREIQPGHCTIFSRLGINDFAFDGTFQPPEAPKEDKYSILRLPEPDISMLEQNLREALIAFDYPQFDPWMPGLFALLRECRQQQKRVVLIEDSTRCRNLTYAEERADRLGMFYGVCVCGVASGEKENCEKKFRTMEHTLWKLVQNKDTDLWKRIYGEEILSFIKKEKNIVSRIRMLGILYQTGLWLESYPIVVC